MSSSCGQAVQGTGLAFIVYTEAIKNMEVSQLWSVLYFFMLLMLGIGSMLGNTAAILTPLTDSKVISSYLPKEAISGEWASEGGGARGGEQREESPQGPQAQREAAAASPGSCHGSLLSGNLGPGTHDSPHASGSPHHRGVKWSPQPWQRPTPPTQPSELSRLAENLLLSLC